MKRVLVFAEKILPRGQTFIPIVVNALRSFEATYIGITPVECYPPLTAPSIILTKNNSIASRIRKELFRLTGIAPGYYKQISLLNASIIHAHFAEGAAGAVSLSRKLQLPFIMHLRGGAELYSDSALRSKLFEWSYLLWRKRLWAEGARFICVSRYIREKARLAGFPEDKLVIHYTGIDFSRFTPSDPPVDRDRNMVLYVGRLVEYKGADHLIRAMVTVRSTNPSAHVVLVGDGPFRGELENLAKQVGVPCSFLGDQPYAIVRTHLERARVFCAPSRTLKDGMSEAFGNVFTEAQAMGLPVVSYRHGGIVESMLEGETGLLAEEGDIDGLAKCIDRFLSEDVFWQGCSDLARQWVRENFDVHKQTEKLEQLYMEVIQKHGSRL